MCNLSEVVVRKDDTLETLKAKARIAAILGTYQATQTNFRYLRPIWRKNTEEEALLGVSLTGIMDHPVLSDHRNPDLRSWLEELRQVAIDTNKEWAEKLGINPSTAITCVKPSGTVSQLVDSASGIHPRFSDHYIRRVRADAKDPLAHFLREQGVPCEVDVMKDTNLVFSFPIKAPEGSVCVDDVTAMDQLELWMVYQEHWCEHKPSITVYYTDDQFLEVGNFVYKHFDKISGISFLPQMEHTYRQAPYEAISADEYEAMVESMPDVDWSLLKDYEKEDTTVGSKTYACSAGSCEVVDLA